MHSPEVTQRDVRHSLRGGVQAFVAGRAAHEMLEPDAPERVEPTVFLFTLDFTAILLKKRYFHNLIIPLVPILETVVEIFNVADVLSFYLVFQLTDEQGTGNTLTYHLHSQQVEVVLPVKIRLETGYLTGGA